MTNLRALAESDLKQVIEGEFSTPVALITPQGRVAETADGRPLVGRVLWSHQEINPETGIPVMVNTPVVTLRASSLKQVPKSGEVWGVIIPEGPHDGAPLKEYITDAAGIAETGRNLGTITIPLVEAIANDT